MLDIDASQEEFQSHILDLLPRLKDAGGYRFLKGNVIYSYYFSVYPYILELLTPETWNPCLFMCISHLVI